MKFCKDVMLPRMVQQLAVLPNNQRKRVQAAVLKGKEWPQGYNIKIKFLDGNSTLHNWVKGIVLQEFQPHVNLKLTFVTKGDADIRISFDTNDGSWSYVGTDAWDNSISQNEPTMNIGWSDEGDGVVLHEFGHAIGPWVHEHQNPKDGIRWNEETVLKSIAGAPNYWDEATARENVLDAYDQSMIRGSSYDPASIMHYFFPREWTLDGRESKQNHVLSATDIQWLKKVYPISENALQRGTNISNDEDIQSEPNDIDKTNDEDIQSEPDDDIDQTNDIDQHTEASGRQWFPKASGNTSKLSSNQRIFVIVYCVCMILYGLFLMISG